MFVLLIIFILQMTLVKSSNETCRRNDNSIGKCTPVRACRGAINEIQKGMRPVICSFDSVNEPVVCCAVDNQVRISMRKCMEYSNLFTKNVLVSSLVLEPSITNIQLNECEIKRSEQFIVGGTVAKPAEFPHMVAIGLKIDSEINWVCGGSIISKRYVISAAHCMRFKGIVPSLVRSGTLTPSKSENSYTDYKIIDIHTPSTYSSRYKYDDIALLRLDNNIRFNKLIRPACLWPRDAINLTTAIATGWGHTKDRGSLSESLLKVELKIYDNSVCARAYEQMTPLRSLNRGIIASHMCAGDLAGGKDTCQGDSGGPLQVILPGSKCSIYIVGITSFGRSCASENSPGVYTRISSYIDWIEKTIWS